MKHTISQSSPAFVLLAFGLALGVSAAAQKPVVPGSNAEVATMSVSAGEPKKVEGTITEKDGDRMTPRTTTGTELAVKLNGYTKVGEKKTNPFRKGRKYQAGQLIP